MSNFTKGGNKNKSSKRPPKANRKSQDNMKKDDVNSFRDQNDVNKPKRGYNDPSWYGASSQLIKDAASISMNTPTGINLDLGVEVYGTPVDSSCNKVPGVMAFDVLMGPGRSNDNSSAINIAARQEYSFIRHANSGHSNYDSPDLMQFLLAMDSVYAFYNWVKRMYGVIMQYNSVNRYYPKQLVYAMGFNFDDIVKHLPEVRHYLNVLASKINSVYVPSHMSFMLRHSWLFSNVYMDSPDPKSQLYLFRPSGFYMLEETELPAVLKYTHRTIKYFTYDNIRTLGDQLLAAIIESEDMGIMSGDIKKAYGENLFKVSPITEDYAITPVYNPEVLLQIHNATILGENVSQCDITVDPDTNAILWDPVFIAPHWGWATKKILNSHSGALDPNAAMVATRLMVTVESEELLDTGTQVCLHLGTYGTEVVVYAEVYTDPFNHQSSTAFWSVLGCHSLHPNKAYVRNLAVLSQFAHAPIVFAYDREGDTYQPLGPMNFLGIVGDLDNYTVLTNNELTKMHDTAILAEFGVGSR